MAKVGFDKRYAGMILAEHTGSDPETHLWYKAEDGMYRLHDRGAQLPQL